MEVLMNYKYVENLVLLSKNGDMKSKEKLLEEFRPFIINISKRTFIHRYEFEDMDCQHFLIHFLFGHVCKPILNWSHIV